MPPRAEPRRPLGLGGEPPAVRPPALDPAAAGARPPGPGGLLSTSKIKRAEIRRQIRVAQQLKVATLGVVALLLLAAFPVYLWIQSVTQDPVFGQLDDLDLPSWAAGEYTDAASGSRWCIGQCRFRERTWQSARSPEETQAAYDGALRAAGWRARADGPCPTVQDGVATCWHRDEYVLDMWVRSAICPPTRPPISPSRAATPASPGSAAPPVAAPSPTPCPAAWVTVKVFNAIGYRVGP